MTVFLTLVIFASSCFVLLSLLTFKRYLSNKRFQAWYHSPNLTFARRALEHAYSNIDGFSISKQAREIGHHAGYEFTYGEMPILTFAKILELIETNKPITFYDLGSGVGQVVLATALLKSTHKATGIECVPELHQSAESAKALVREHASVSDKVDFICADFLTVNFSDADVVFVNATGLFGPIWEALQEKLLALKKESWVILTTKKLPQAEFECVNSALRLMSWGYTTVNVYRKT